MSEKICALMCGVPGSGKSTKCKEVTDALNAVYLSADAIRAELMGDANDNTQNARVFGTLFGRLKKALTQGRNIMVDNTNYNRKNRKEILAMAKRAGYVVHVYEMSTPHEVSRERNKARERVVPDDVMDRMIGNYQAPDPSTEYIQKVFSV